MDDGLPNRATAKSDPDADVPDTGTSVAKKTNSSQTNKKGFHPYPFYTPRFWHGMRPSGLLALLRQGHFHFSLGRFPHAIGASIAAPFNTTCAGVQKLLFSRRLAAAELHGPPVFIIGHWRSGTTLLHELMVRDERLSSPSTFQCFAPHHFLVTEWAFRKFFTWLLPGKRPMDNMSAGWERPQEDEFALMNLGLPSPYRRMAFPNEGPVDMDYLDFEGVSDKDQQTWSDAMRQFLLAVSTVTGRPLVIKSPTHTGRIRRLAKEFPDAKFIHITRDPRELFPSTCRLWRGLCDAQSMQEPNHEDEVQYVIECLRRMYAAFNRDREMIEPHRLIDVRYEDLTARPVDTMQHIYESLRLSDFETVRPSIQQWADTENKTYKANQHRLSEEDESLIKEAWKAYFDRYGY
ncbi:MAG: sulfotransferase [Pirellulaceae bacterium]|nr:sulfotransferase [Pirellulaceae bacterium]